MKKKIVRSWRLTKKDLKSPGQRRPGLKLRPTKEGIVKGGRTKETISAQSIGLFNLRAPCGSHKKRKYLGRGPGSGHGKTSTRGSKGQTSRAGRDFYLGFEGGQSPLIRRFPKRGFTNKFKKEYQIVNLSDLDRIKESTVTLGLLEARGIIKDKTKLVKVLGDGQIKNPVSVQAHAFSKHAAEEIKNAGGKIEIIDV